MPATGLRRRWGAVDVRPCARSRLTFVVAKLTLPANLQGGEAGRLESLLWFLAPAPRWVGG
jgi:hypothetical protein